MMDIQEINVQPKATLMFMAKVSVGYENFPTPAPYSPGMAIADAAYATDVPGEYGVAPMPLNFNGPTNDDMMFWGQVVEKFIPEDVASEYDTTALNIVGLVGAGGYTSALDFGMDDGELTSSNSSVITDNSVGGIILRIPDGTVPYPTLKVGVSVPVTPYVPPALTDSVGGLVGSMESHATWEGFKFSLPISETIHRELVGVMAPTVPSTAQPETIDLSVLPVQSTARIQFWG